MGNLNDTLEKLDTNQDIGYSLVRIFLGTALFVRGLILIANPGAIFVLDTHANMHLFYSYITIMHLVGGFFMALGLFTRVAAFIQVPILFSAVFIVHAGEGLMISGQSLELAVLVLVLLLTYLIFGSGTLALNNYFNLKL